MSTGNRVSEIDVLRERESRIKRRIKEMQTRNKKAERKLRTTRLVLWGVVVESLLKSRHIVPTEWADACRRTLTKQRDFEAATDILLDHSQHMRTEMFSSGDEKQCAPTAGESE